MHLTAELTKDGHMITAICPEYQAATHASNQEMALEQLVNVIQRLRQKYPNRWTHLPWPNSVVEFRIVRKY
jgi:hypothetical protein